MFLRTVRDPLHRVGPKEAFGARQWKTGNRHESRILNHHDPPWAKAWTPILAAWATGYLGAKASSGKGAPGVNGLGTFTDQKCLKVTKGYKRLLIVVVFVQLLLKGLFTSFHLIFWALLGWLQVLIVDRPPASKKKAEKRHGWQWVSKQSKGQGARPWYAFIILDLTLIRFDHSNLLHRFYQDFGGFFPVDL